MPQEPDDIQDTDQLEGRYANYFQVGHNAFEFMLDFSQHSHESRTIRWHTRIITVPFFAKSLFTLLEESITQHEQRFGSIPEEDAAE
jgi:Protein of unknown function (DUF3467)